MYYVIAGYLYNIPWHLDILLESDLHNAINMQEEAIIITHSSTLHSYVYKYIHNTKW